MENMKRTLAKWGFQLAKEAPNTRTFFPGSSSFGQERNASKPSCMRDVEQVKQMLAEQGVTPEMILKHPYIRLTKEAQKYLEELKQV
jgi:hypothetical protein